jgi:hypothetical protein
MQIKETIGVSFPGSVESPPLEDVVVLVDSAGVALGVQRAFSARVGGVHDGGGGLIASRYVAIPLVGSDGEVSGILCHASPRSDTYADVHKGLRMPGSRSTWEMTVPRKELNMQVVSNSGGLFAGER